MDLLRMVFQCKEYSSTFSEWNRISCHGCSPNNECEETSCSCCNHESTCDRIMRKHIMKHEVEKKHM